MIPALVPMAMIESGIYSEPKFERLRAELGRAEPFKGVSPRSTMQLRKIEQTFHGRVGS